MLPQSPSFLVYPFNWVPHVTLVAFVSKYCRTHSSFPLRFTASCSRLAAPSSLQRRASPLAFSSEDMSTETASSRLDPSILRLRKSLEACAQPLDDASVTNKAVAEVIEILNSINCVPQSDNNTPELLLEDENSIQGCTISEEALIEVYSYLSNSPSKQMVIDALSMDLPIVVSRMGTLSERCHEMAKDIIELFVCTCNPRDMVTILCEALDGEIQELKALLYYLLLFNGLEREAALGASESSNFNCSQCPFQVSVLHLEEEHKKGITDLFEAAIRIGGSIQEMCKNMDGGRKEELCALLGLYLLRIIALISKSRQKMSSDFSVVLHTLKFLPFCGFSYFGLITGSDVTTAIDIISKEDDVDHVGCFSLSKDGASLAVIWGHINGDIANSIGEELELVVKKIQKNWIEMWQAIGLLKYPLSSVSYDWEIKEHALEILSSILDGGSLDEPKDQNFDFSSFVPSIFTTLQAIQMVMMGAVDASLQKKAFVVLKKIISAIPSADRFDILKALISNSTSSSMKALLIDNVREQTAGQYKNATKAFSWSAKALDLVGIMLRPPGGGPPAFPDDSEPVLSSLNLLRFLLIKESTAAGQSDGMKVLTQQVLRKIYSEWLLPLRTLVTGIRTDNENDDDEFAAQLQCGLNPVLFVLYRCIELAEQNMKH